MYIRIFQYLSVFFWGDFMEVDLISLSHKVHT